MTGFGNSMFFAPEPPRISSEVYSRNISWPTSVTQAMLSSGGSPQPLMKRSHKDVLGGEISNDGEPPKKRRGRPPGSKNKPKQQPNVTTRDSESSMKAIIIEVSKGLDVIQALVNFACSINCAITVVSGIGLITHTSLGLPIPQAQALIFNGSYSLQTLKGVVLVRSAARMENNGSFSRYVLPSRTSISVSIAGPEGYVSGGVVAGKLIAGSTVTILAIALKNSCIHNVSTTIDPNRESTSTNGGGGFGIHPTSSSFMATSNFNVDASARRMNNIQIADGMNVIQSGQPSFTPY